MNNIDLRYKASQEYILNNIGKPVYKKTAFYFIRRKLGPSFKWINKSPEEYFSPVPQRRLVKCAEILDFKPGCEFQDIKNNYRELSKTWHPDKGGHKNAFAILNYAYNLFKKIYYNGEF